MVLRPLLRSQFWHVAIDPNPGHQRLVIQVHAPLAHCVVYGNREDGAAAGCEGDARNPPPVCP